MDTDNDITHASRCKIYLHLPPWLRARLVWLGERVFAATDSSARQQDWQIISTHAGLGRQYRDPRFHSLAACRQCRGRGTEDTGGQCQTCNGSGRIISTGQADYPPPRSLA